MIKTLRLKILFQGIIFSFFLVFSGSLPVLAAEAPPARPPEFVLKLSAVAPEGTSWADTAHKFQKYVEQKSAGRIKVIWYLGGIMGDEPDEFLKIKMGQLQGAGLANVGLGMIATETRILSLPFLFNNSAEIDFVLDRMQPQFQRLFEEKGFYLAGWLDIGFSYWFLQKPVESIQDFPKCRMWAWKKDPVITEFAELLGFQNVPVGFPDLLMALKAGQLDSFYSPLYAALTLQWYAYAKYIIDLPFALPPSAIVMDRKFIESLPPDLRKIIMEGWDLYLPELRKISRVDNQKAYQGFLKEGIREIKLNEDNVKAIREKARPLYQKFIGQYYPAWLLTRLQDTLKEYRSKN
ncbi:MAG: TRAP transporter substrate-binding protein DctP [bacterium]|nr:TRAP transporter substrate-binding protein DctP [bacterium]